MKYVGAIAYAISPNTTHALGQLPTVVNLDYMSKSYYLRRHLMVLQQVKDTKGSKEKTNSKCALKERYGKT